MRTVATKLVMDEKKKENSLRSHAKNLVMDEKKIIETLLV